MKALKEALAKKKEGLEIKIILQDGDAQKGVMMPDVKVEQEDESEEESSGKKMADMMSEEVGYKMPMNSKMKMKKESM